MPGSPLCTAYLRPGISDADTPRQVLYPSGVKTASLSSSPKRGSDYWPDGIKALGSVPV